MARPWVVDASVAAKWFLKDSLEDHVDLAEEVLVELLAGETDLHAPRLMSYEVCRLIWKACMAQDADKGNTDTDRVVDLIRPGLSTGVQLDLVTSSLSLFAFAGVLGRCRHPRQVTKEPKR